MGMHLCTWSWSPISSPCLPWLWRVCVCACATTRQSDNMFKDAIDTASQSGNRDSAEDLLRYFVEKKDKECFAACLYSCYPLIRPDIALELAWRSRYMDYVMPFLIQFLRHSSEKVWRTLWAVDFV